MDSAVFKYNIKECTGCLACVDTCHHNAISYTYDKYGHLIPVLDNERCVGCGLCDSICPIGKKNLNLLQKSIPYAAWGKDKSLRKSSASGGIFATIARFVIMRGGYVSGAVLEGNTIVHIVSNNVDDIVRMQGTKYQQGIPVGIYKCIKRLIYDGNVVLFSGSPCQVASLRRFVGETNRLITIDFICGGFPSILPLDSFLKHECDEADCIVSYRNKDNGWKSSGYKYCLKMMDKDGIIQSLGDNNLVTRAFTSHLLCRESCYDCSFAKADRVSDITMGDYWGCKDYEEEHNDGISVLVLHNPVLYDFLRDAGLEIHEIAWHDFIHNNSRMVCGKYFGYKESILHQAAPLIFKYLPYSIVKSLYGVSGSNRFGTLIRKYITRSLYSNNKTLIKKYIEEFLKNREL